MRARSSRRESMSEARHISRYMKTSRIPCCMGYLLAREGCLSATAPFRDIEAAVERGATGRLITSTYQNFTDIESLKSFLNLQSRCPNFACRLDHECFHDSGYAVIGFHSKGYLFEFEDSCELVIGSSNITRYALLKNIEWDLVVHEQKGASVYGEAMKEFEEKWQETHPLDSEIIAQYSTRLNFAIERWDMDYDLSAASIKPNFMQRRVLKELNRHRAVGTNRALVVAAAGARFILMTGRKAFKNKDFGPVFSIALDAECG